MSPLSLFLIIYTYTTCINVCLPGFWFFFNLSFQLMQKRTQSMCLTLSILHFLQDTLSLLTPLTFPQNLTCSVSQSQARSVCPIMFWKGACMHPQLHLTLCDPMDCSSPDSSVRKTSRQEYWSGLPFPFPGDLPDPGIEPAISCVSCIGRWILYH